MRKNVDKKSIKKFGKQVAAVRKRKGITQEELSYKSNLSLSQIARIEIGVINTSVNSIFIIAKALEVEPKELFDFKGSK